MLQHGARGRAVNQHPPASGLEEQVRRLADEVGRLSGQIEAIACPLGADHEAVMTRHLVQPTARNMGARQLLRSSRPPLPDPRLIHRIIRQRRLRQRYFEGQLFADPAWDILLDLAAARAEHRRVSVTSLCIAASVPATTALRWITQMTAMGILVREPDTDDRRRAFIALSDRSADAIAKYFDELDQYAATAV